MMRSLAFMTVLGVLAIGSSEVFASFFDDFESSDATPYSWQEQSDGTQPSSESDPATINGVTMSAQPGDWYGYSNALIPDIDAQVTSHPIPGAASGNNYLRLHRSGNPDVVLAATFEPWDVPQTTGVIVAEWKMYIPSADDNPFQAGIWLTGKLDNDNSSGLFAASPTFFVKSDGTIRSFENFLQTTVEFTLSNFQPDTWQTWKLVTDLDAKTAYIDLEGEISQTMGFNDTFSDPIGANGLAFHAAAAGGAVGSEYYIDDVSVQSITPLPSAYTADFNNDGMVDSDDLLEWQAAYAIDGSADADDDGDSDGRDFLIWQQQAGSGVPAPMSVASVVPEPSTAGLMMFSLSALLFRRRKILA